MDGMLDRRHLLKGALLVPLAPLAAGAQTQAPPPPTIAGSGANAGPGALGAFLQISPDGTVTLRTTTTELGQGTHTAHAQIVADELGCALEAVRVVVGQPEPALRLVPVNEMYTGASFGVRVWEPRLRRGAAAARSVLIAAAAERLGVPAGELRAESGRVVHAASGRALPFGELVEAAARLPLPEQPPLKPREERTTGRSVQRPDIPPKTRGAAIYGVDVRLPGMLFAVARLPEVFGAAIESFDARPALAVPGVTHVVPIPRGLAVVATTTWAAMRGAEALRVTWRATPHDGLDSAGVSARLREALDRPEAQRPRNDGDWEAVKAAAARVVSATYEVPYLAHAPMETENATVRISGDRAEIWAPTQHQDWCVRDVAQVLGIPPAHVTMHTTFAGGGFGRRLHVEIAAQAAHVARAVGRPVQLLWRREDEFAQGYYRPAFAARMEAALDAEGRVTGFAIRGAGGSIMYDYRPWLFRNPNFVDPFALQSVTDTRYRFGQAFRAEYARVDLPPKVWLWRSVGSSQYGFFLESFLDEVAHAAGKDPLALRRELLAHDQRALNVLNTAAERGGWGTPAPAGRHRGLAYMEAYGSLCAQVAEISIERGELKVHKVTVAIDCGDVVNPDAVAAQMEGSVVWALSAMKHEQVTLRNGRAEQRNFDSYRIARIGEAPMVETHIIRSGQPLGGVGEPGVPPLAPAVCNAIFAATGKRIRRLPLAGQDLTRA
ncbi:MAG: molybdopterin-dependent oxidoreductase [Roseococcus sp.]|nr:molybdopterin-dependent oxidoreductase [Roseococcus sp.]